MRRWPSVSAIVRSAPTSAAHSVPVRRGAAALAVTGGTLALVGAAGPALVVPVPPTGDLAPVTSLALAADAAEVPDVALLSAVEPVAPAPDRLDASELVKAVQLVEQELARAEEARRAAEEQARAEAEAAAAAAAEAAAEEAREAAQPAAARSPDCGIDDSGLGSVESHVRDAAEFLGCLFGEPDILGAAGRAGASDHPAGLALDFMVDRSTGDALADCALRNMDALGITYVIWEQRINHGNGWELMADRGGVTANHFDHVHVSFRGSGGDGGELRGC